MEYLVPILLIPIFLLIVVIIFWILKIWIIDGWLGGLKFKEFKEQKLSKKTIIFWIIFVIVFNFISKTLF